MKRLLLEFARIRLTAWILLAMFIAMIVGSIFPQGYDPEMYISSWGEEQYEAIARWGVLNLFRSPLFYVLGALLFVNLVACSIVRWSGRRGAGPGAGGPPDYAREIAIPGGPGESRDSIVAALESRGYRVLSKGENAITARRGPWPEGVSLLYHLALALLIVGFVISALYAFEGDVTLFPGEPVDVPTVSASTKAAELFGARADTARHVTVVLDEFVTEWELYEGDYYPRDWISLVRVTTSFPGGTTTVKHRIEVNRPLRVEGLTFYQMAYEQSFDVVVLRDGEEVERVGAQSYTPFTLDSIGGTFYPGTLRVGTLYEKYGDTRPVVPHTPLKWSPPAPAPADSTAIESSAGGESGVAETEQGLAATSDTMSIAVADTAAPMPMHGHGGGERLEIGDLSAEKPLIVAGAELLLDDPYEGSVLTYRHDPGVPLLYVAFIVFMAVLAIRIYWPSYRVSVWLEDSDGRPSARLTFRATGMLGEPEALEDSLARDLEGTSARGSERT